MDSMLVSTPLASILHVGPMLILSQESQVCTGISKNQSDLTAFKDTSTIHHVSNSKNVDLGLKSISLEPLKALCTGYHNLPRNVLVKIFSYFPEREISSCLSPVCRNWRLASQDASLWKHLQFKGSRVPTATICSMLRRARQLETISLVSVPEVITILRQICRSNLKVKIVAVKSCTKLRNEERIPDTVFGHLIRSCTEVQSLNLDNTQFFVKNFVQDLVRLPHLTSLNLSNSLHLRARDLVTLSYNCWRLEELKVARRKFSSAKNSLTDADAALIFDNLKDSLKTLKFDLRGLGPASYEAILRCSKIQSLHLNNAFYITGDILQCFPVCFPNIKMLKLERADLLTTVDFGNLFALHKNTMKNLTYLKLIRCWKLDDSGLKTIVETCADSLECLSVRSCKLLTIEGIQYAVSQCCKLSYLDVAHVIQLDEPLMMHILNEAHFLKVLVVDASCKGVLNQMISKKPDLQIKRSFSEYFKYYQSRESLK